jgi:hypothetical protein
MISESELLMLPIWRKAPCRPDGQIDSCGQEESKEATCFCPANPKGCCVDGGNNLIPYQLLPDIDLSQLTPEQREALKNFK